MASREASGAEGGAREPARAFVWNAGGWLGAQLGSTLWLLILGLVLLPRDMPSALLCLGIFALLNALGCFLWRLREYLSAYKAYQTFLGAAAALFATVIVLLKVQGVSEPPAPGSTISTYLPLWAVWIAPGMML